MGVEKLPRLYTIQARVSWSCTQSRHIEYVVCGLYVEVGMGSGDVVTYEKVADRVRVL